jgi:hypothetical protein
MIKLSQQAVLVALAAIVPVITSVYKLRVFDATILALSGVLAVYNVNCLTRGNCNAWATLVAVSFFVTTLFQLRKREGIDPFSMPPSLLEYNDNYKNKYLPTSLKIKMILNKNETDLDDDFIMFNDLDILVNIVNSFIQEPSDFFDVNDVYNQIISGLPEDGGLITKLATIFSSISDTLGAQITDIFAVANTLLDSVIEYLNNTCTTTREEIIDELPIIIEKIKKWEEIEDKLLKLITNPPEFDLNVQRDEVVQSELNKIWDGKTDPY